MQRETKQRGAIRCVLDASDSPLLPAEVLLQARKAVPTMSLATVYRTLNAFAQEGLARVVSLPAEPPRYEKAGKSHHHHFVCRGCRKVFEVHACVDSIQQMVPEGFQVQEHEITLYGQCNRCRKNGKDRV